jgi:hypothetical protein
MFVKRQKLAIGQRHKKSPLLVWQWAGQNQNRILPVVTIAPFAPSQSQLVPTRIPPLSKTEVYKMAKKMSFEYRCFRFDFGRENQVGLCTQCCRRAKLFRL